MEYEKSVKIDDKFCATLTIKITKDTVKKEYDTFLLENSKKLNLPGFRPGKVPIKILETKYSTFLLESLFTHMMEECLKDAFQTLPHSEQPIMASSPEMKEHTKFELSSDFSFDVVYDVEPRQEILQDSGFNIKLAHVYVSDEDVESELYGIRIRNAIVKEKEGEAVVEKDDLVTIDYHVFCEEKEEKKMEDYVFFVGSYDDSYRFDDDILGMKKGEEKEIIKEYPQDFALEELRGTKKRILLKIKAIKSRQLPELNDDLAQDVNEAYKTLEDLKVATRKKLERIAEDINRNNKKEAMMVSLLKVNPLHIPESMVRGVFANIYKSNAEKRNMSVAMMDKVIGMSREEYYQSVRGNIYRQLHSSFIFNKLKENYQIKIEDDKIEDELVKYSQNNNVELQELKDVLKTKKAEVYSVLEEDKLYQILFEKSNFEITGDIKVMDYNYDDSEIKDVL